MPGGARTGHGIGPRRRERPGATGGPCRRLDDCGMLCEGGREHIGVRRVALARLPRVLWTRLW